MMKFWAFAIPLTLMLCPPFMVDSFAEEVKTLPADQATINLSFAPLVKQVSPAVVNIYTTRTITKRYGHPFMDDPFFRQFFGDMPGLGQGGSVRRQVEGALGSGVIVNPEGLVVTNSHVVEGADEIKVVLADGREFEARLTLKDAPSDVALLRIENKPAALPFAPLRSSEDLEVGDLVLAIGNPFGVGQTVTSGIISAVARSSLNINDYNFFIQTDAAINPGNSGGPLVAMDGGVVGINTAIFSQSGGSLGIGFAIPSEMVQSVIAAEASGRKGVIRPWLGVEANTVTSEIAESLGLEKPRGTLISGLHGDSPLKKAGVKIGDVLLTLNGHEIRDPSEMKFRMATVKIGETATINYLRQGKIKEAKVVAMAPPENPPRDETTLDNGIFQGVTVSNINPAVVVEMGLEDSETEGVIVKNISGRSYAARILRSGDIVLSLNDRDIANVEILKRTLMMRMSMLNLVIKRNGQIQKIAIR